MCGQAKSALRRREHPSVQVECFSCAAGYTRMSFKELFGSRRSFDLMDGIRITRFRVFKNVRFVGGKIRFHLNMNRPYDNR